MWVIWLAARRGLRRHFGVLFGALITLAITTALVSALLFIVGSADLQQPSVERYQGTPVVVGAADPDQGLPRTLASDLQEVAGVAAAIPETRFAANVLDSNRRIVDVEGTEHRHAWGLGWSSTDLTPFETVEGDAPSAPGQVALDSAVAAAGGFSVGDEVDIAILGVVRPFQISAIVAPADGTNLHFQSVVLFTDQEATDLSGMSNDRIVTVGLIPTRGTDLDQIREAVSDAVAEWDEEVLVATGTHRGEFEGNINTAQDAEAAQRHSEYAVTALVVGAGMTSGAIGLAWRRRGQDIVTLRALGAVPLQIAVLVCVEAVLLAAIALLAGLPTGAVLAHWIVSWDLGPQAGLSEAFTVHPTLATIGQATFIILSATLIAGLVGSHYAWRLRPAEALHDVVREGRPPSRVRVGAGVATLMATGTGGIILRTGNLQQEAAATLALTLFVLTVISAGLLAPTLVRLVTRAARRMLGSRLNSGAGLAIANSAFYHRRFASGASPLVLGLCFAGAAGAMQLYFNVENADQETAEFTADFVVDTAEPTDRLSEAARREVDQLPAVQATTSAIWTQLTVVDERGRNLHGDPIRVGVEGGPLGMVVIGEPSAVTDIGLLSGSYRPGDPDTVLVDRWFSDEHDVDVGSRINLNVPGLAEAAPKQVGAIFDGGYLRGASVAVSGAAADEVDRGGALDDVLLVAAADGQHEQVGVMLHELFPITDDGGPFLVQEPDQQWQAAWVEHADRNRGGGLTFFMIGAFAVLAGVNGIAAGQADRRREFASMRILGMRWSQVQRVVFAEVVLLVAIGVALGLAASWWTGYLMTLSSPVRGMELVPQLIPSGRLALLSGGGLLLALLGSLTVVNWLRRTGGRR